MPGANSLTSTLREALGLHHAGRLAEAEAVYRRILSSQPRNFDALHFLGVLRAQGGDMTGAVALIGKALEINPNSPLAHFHIAGAYAGLGRAAKALASYERAVALKPDFAEAHSARARILLDIGHAAQAVAACERAIAANPNIADTHLIRGNALLVLDRTEEALNALDRTIMLSPGSAEAYYNRGNTLVTLERNEEALAAFGRAIALKPDYAEALNNRGDVLCQLGRYKEALADCERSVALAPGKSPGYHNMGNALMALERAAEAMAAYDRAIALDPNFAKPYYGRVGLWRDLGRFEEALADAEKALALDPANGRAACEAFYATGVLCDWRDRASRVDDLVRRCREGQLLYPWPLLSAFDDPELHRIAAKKFGGSALSGTLAAAGSSERLRVAYLSADFHDHAVSYQVVELFERHDRTRLETYGICLRSGSDTPMRRRLRHAFDHFIELGARSDREVAQTLADLHIGIVVDLNGYTGKSRSKMLSLRPAPIAVNYLGFPGTLGTNYVDYIIADARVIPVGSESYYSENVVRLPDCYLPSDTRDRGDPEPPSRSAAGLPEQGFVFCVFNNAYKITPGMFDIWMRLLRKVDGSVLWLSVSNPAARDNLRAEAEARGVSPGRLIFAGYTEERAQHLARIALADLFLDTLPYNAHSTASDMLWAGVPVVTCMGRSFASRVAGSMLSAIGAEELITHDLGAYEALAFDLARSPERLAAVRGKLARSRASHPLFDTARLCRQLEAAYETMWDFHLKGEKPQSFTVNILAEPSPS